jgi:hypothetical protein
MDKIYYDWFWSNDVSQNNMSRKRCLVRWIMACIFHSQKDKRELDYMTYDFVLFYVTFNIIAVMLWLSVLLGENSRVDQ